MIKRANPIRTAVLVVSAICSGCMPDAHTPAAGPTTLIANAASAAVSTQPAVAAASVDVRAPRVRGVEAGIGASTRGDGAVAAEIPSSQPADVAALADRAGGLAGGFIVGAIPAMLQGDSLARAKRSNDEAEQHPAQVANVLPRAVADLNGDGFITLDEITAMKRAGLDESQMLLRLHQSAAVFSATTRQEQYLLDRGVPDAVVKGIAAPASATQPTTP